MRQIFGTAFALVLASGTLAACGSEPEQVAVEEGIEGLRAENARLVLPPVAGNPAAVYFDLTYDGDRGLALRKASVADAESTMLHDYGEYDFKVQMMEMLPLRLEKGQTYSFEPGGKHVMAMNPSPDLKPGDTTEVTLTVAGGDTFSFPAEVRAAGEER